MIVDASALLAILLGEPEAGWFAEVIERASTAPFMGAVNWMEVAIQVDRRGGAYPASLDALILSSDLRIVPATIDHAHLARQAYARFGKGNHPARQNMGDCFAYALAKERALPLLFKGDDYSKTDIRPAI